MEPNQTPVQPPLPVQPVPEPTKKSLPKWPLIIVGVILLATLLTGGYLLGQKSNNRVACTLEAKLCPNGSSVGRTGPKCEFSPCPKTPTPTLVPVATDSGTLIATETANWKTVSNASYSIKIPSNWYTESSTNTYLRVQNYNPVGAPGRSYDPNQDKGMFALEIGKVEGKSYSIADLKKLVEQLNTENSKNLGTPAVPTINDATTINGMPVLKITATNNTNGNNLPTYYILNDKGDVFFIGPRLDLSAGKDYFPMIVNSFKFIP